MILVRDGRATVRSALNRQLPIKGRHRKLGRIRPESDDPYSDKWDSMEPFEHICWWWNDSYRTLLRDLPDVPIVHFENLLSDYQYFNTNVVEPFGLELTEEQWTVALQRKSKNATKTYRVPHWKEWGPDLNEPFKRHCAEMMVQLGYDDPRENEND